MIRSLFSPSLRFLAKTAVKKAAAPAAPTGGRGAAAAKAAAEAAAAAERAAQARTGVVVESDGQIRVTPRVRPPPYNLFQVVADLENGGVGQK